MKAISNARLYRADPNLDIPLQLTPLEKVLGLGVVGLSRSDEQVAIDTSLLTEGVGLT